MATQHKVWIDGRGQEVPASYVKAYDKARDRAVRRVLAGALKLRAQMEAFMADAVKTMDGLAAMKESLGTPEAGSIFALYSVLLSGWRVQIMRPRSQNTNSGSPACVAYSNSDRDGSDDETRGSLTRVTRALKTDIMFWIA